MIIDHDRLFCNPLLSTKTAEYDDSITEDGNADGRIMLRPAAFGVTRWFWTTTGPVLVAAGLASDGEAAPLEDARKAFRAQFDRWITWADTAHKVHWYGHENA